MVVCGRGKTLGRECLAWTNEGNVLELMDTTNSALHLRSKN